MIRGRTWAALGLTVLSVFTFFYVVPPIPQNPTYHNFADQRVLLGVPHGLDVLSNVGFLIVGALGLIFLARKGNTYSEDVFVTASERWAYIFFCAGVLLTAFGSTYYHLAPDDARLVWDRLPMAIGFMALLAAVISERVDTRLGVRLLAPLVALGIGSVLYWRWTALRGHDDLRLYGLVQFGSIAALILLASFSPSRYTRGTDIFIVAVLYGLAKVFESIDRRIFTLGNIVSGHTLKHLVAALACYWVLRMLMLREPGLKVRQESTVAGLSVQSRFTDRP